MAYNVVIVPGKQFTVGELWTDQKMNQGFNPTVQVTGNLNSADDVVITAPADGEPVVWDTGTSKWINGTVAALFLPTLVGAGALDGTAGMVPAPLVADKNSFLRGDGQWGSPDSVLGSDLYLRENYA
jgi:hypothetical protein